MSGEDLEKELAAAKSEVAKLKSSHIKATAQLVAQHEAAMQNLTAQHTEDAKVWKDALAKPNSDHDSQFFKYVVRGCPAPMLSGSVPRSIFEAEPNSALAHLYDSEWKHAKDGEGRAVVNSDPEHWPLILNWLSFGAVPSNPSESLIAECKYWQLDRLLAALDIDTSSMTQAVSDSHRLNITPVKIAGDSGFTVSGMIYDFTERFVVAVDTQSEVEIPFTAAGRHWRLDICQRYFDLCMLTGPAITIALGELKLGSGAGCVSILLAKLGILRASASCTNFSRFWRWRLTTKEAEQIMHPSVVSLEGTLVFTANVTSKL